MKPKIRYPEVGICGISCRFCPRYYTEGKSRCGGCKSEYMLAVGCPFITCAIKRKGIETCCECEEYPSCGKIMKQIEFSKSRDTFVCYQRLEDNLNAIDRNGIGRFDRTQREKATLLKNMLNEFNDGRSKSYYCIASTVLQQHELRRALDKARKQSSGLSLKEKVKALRALLDDVAREKGYLLKLRK